MNKLKPYIGINGASSAEIDLVKTPPFLSALGYTAFAGVQATQKTQIDNLTNRYGNNWHPVGEAMRRWWMTGNCLDRVLHINTDDKSPTTVRLITKIMLSRTIVPDWDQSEHGTEFAILTQPCRRVQFNNLPLQHNDYRPLFEELADNNASPRLSTIIAQANSHMLNELTPVEFATTIKQYEPTISSVLIDGSGGKGVPLDAAKVRPYIDSIQDLDINIGIAGGFSATTLEPLAGQLLDEFAGLSIDAESGLRDNYTPADPSLSVFSIVKANEFIRAAANILSRNVR